LDVEYPTVTALGQVAVARDGELHVHVAGVSLADRRVGDDDRRGEQRAALQGVGGAHRGAA
jgi:hypothetical protein